MNAADSETQTKSKTKWRPNGNKELFLFLLNKFERETIEYGWTVEMDVHEKSTRSISNDVQTKHLCYVSLVRGNST